MSKPSGYNLRIQVRETAVKAVSRIYRGSIPNTAGGRENVVKLAQALEQFILEPVKEE